MPMILTQPSQGRRYLVGRDSHGFLAKDGPQQLEANKNNPRKFGAPMTTMVLQAQPPASMKSFHQLLSKNSLLGLWGRTLLFMPHGCLSCLAII